VVEQREADRRRTGSPAPRRPSARGPGSNARAWAARSLTPEGNGWPLALYLALSLGLFGIPVAAHFATHIIAFEDGDPSVFMYWFAWWPHALLHGLNPFVTHQILYPDGYNLEWATSMPLPSVLLAPITLAFGPSVTWNVLELLAPALSAWTAFLLCRHIVGRTGPSLIGGYLFGFSPYMLTHLQSSPNLALVALVPVFVLIVLRRLEATIGPRRFVVEMALALTAQYLIGTEVLATSLFFGAVALVLALALMPERRRQLLEVIGWLAVSLVAMAVLVSPFLAYFLLGAHYPPTETSFPADLASFVLPPAGVALQLHAHPPFRGSALEDYLGVPLVLIICLFWWRHRRARVAWLLVGCLTAALVASLGGRLLVRGDRTSVWLPWRLVEHLPLLRYAIPVRLVLFALLPAAVVVAIWLRGSGRGMPERDDRTGAAWLRPLRWALALLAVASIIPSVGSAAWDTPLTTPPFFAHHAYRAYLSSSDHVLTIPFWGPNQRWVAAAGFPFALSAGSGGQGQNPAYTRFPIWRTLIAFPYPLPPRPGYELRRFLRAKRVTAIVVEQGFPGPWARLFGTLGVRPVATGGVLVYRLTPLSPRHTATINRPSAATPT
jgi:hypothetical protein